MSSVTNALSFVLGSFVADTMKPDLEVPRAALMEFKEEAPYLEALREEATMYLRSFHPSKYVMDGAKVNWLGPTILGRQHGLHS